MTEPVDFNSYHSGPLLVVISGQSGVGKDSVIQRMKERRLPFHFVVTTTDRRPRPGEEHGEDYFFISTGEFAQMIEQGQLLEWARVYEDLKGVPKQQVRDALEAGKDVVMRVDVQGAQSIKKIVPDVLLIFLTTENEAEMERRLRMRDTENEEDLQLRIATARQERKRIHEFDYVVINKENQLDETVEIILSIIRAEHHRIPARVLEL